MSDEQAFWFADLSDDPAPGARYQPFVQISSGCFPLPIWFATAAECEDWIQEMFVGAGRVSVSSAYASHEEALTVVRSLEARLARLTAENERLTSLLADMDIKQHMVEFRDDGWTVLHPMTERFEGSLFDCKIGFWHLDDDQPLRGRFWVNDDGSVGAAAGVGVPEDTK